MHDTRYVWVSKLQGFYNSRYVVLLILGFLIFHCALGLSW